MEKQGGLELNWGQVLSAALAAMSSAVLLSTVGVAGTIIGAALGSVVLTVGGAVYSHYLAVSRQRMAAARAAAVERALRIRSQRRGAADTLATDATPQESDLAREPATEELAAEPATDEERPVTWRDALRGLPWKRIAAISAAVFVLVMATIVVFELLTGRAVSTYTGGSSREDGPRTSLAFLGGGGPDREQEDEERRQEDQAPTDEGPADAPAGGGGADGGSGGGATTAPTQATTPPPEDVEEEPAPERASPTPAEPTTTVQPTRQPTVAPTPEPTTAEPTTEETAPTSSPS